MSILQSRIELYKTIVSDLKKEIEEGMLFEYEEMQILRKKEPEDLPTKKYRPVIDFYYSHEDEVLMYETDYGSDQQNEQAELHYLEYLEDRSDLTIITAKNLIIELERYIKLVEKKGKTDENKG